MSVTATVATRPCTYADAAMAPAESISDMIQPPNMSPAGLVSAGMARTREASSPRGAGKSCGVSADHASASSTV